MPVYRHAKYYRYRLRSAHGDKGQKDRGVLMDGETHEVLICCQMAKT